jgi:cobalt-zinc-cadmium efflux system membrane fusion protein
MKDKVNKYILLIIILPFFWGCNQNKNTSTTTSIAENSNKVSLSEEQTKISGIKTGKFEEKEISETLKVNGIIDVPPQNLVSISVPLGGYLSSTKLLPGMHISKGEVIAEMEDQQYIQLQQEYLTSKAKLEYLQSEFNRQEILIKSNASSSKVFEMATSDYKSQKILVRSLSEKLKLIGVNPEKLNENNISKTINIFSPIDGYVSKVNVNIGKYVNPTDVLFELINPSDIHLALTIFENDINKLSIGQQLLAYNNQKSSKKYKCEIILIGKDFGSDKSINVHCHFEEYDKTLLPGMFMNAEIELKSKKSNALPTKSIVSFEGKNYIFVLEQDKTYAMEEVILGNTENGFTEISPINQGINNSSYIVTDGAYNLLMKMKNNEEE